MNFENHLTTFCSFKSWFWQPKVEISRDFLGLVVLCYRFFVLHFVNFSLALYPPQIISKYNNRQKIHLYLKYIK